MLKILRGEAFISVMQAVAFMAVFELLLGQGHIDSGVIYIALLFSSIGVLLSLLLRATAPTGRKSRRH